MIIKKQLLAIISWDYLYCMIFSRPRIRVNEKGEVSS